MNVFGCCWPLRARMAGAGEDEEGALPKAERMSALDLRCWFGLAFAGAAMD